MKQITELDDQACHISQGYYAFNFHHLNQQHHLLQRELKIIKQELTQCQQDNTRLIVELYEAKQIKQQKILVSGDKNNSISYDQNKLKYNSKTQSTIQYTTERTQDNSACKINASTSKIDIHKSQVEQSQMQYTQYMSRAIKAYARPRRDPISQRHYLQKLKYSNVQLEKEQRTKDTYPQLKPLISNMAHNSNILNKLETYQNTISAGQIFIDNSSLPRIKNSDFDQIISIQIQKSNQSIFNFKSQQRKINEQIQSIIKLKLNNI